MSFRILVILVLLSTPAWAKPKKKPKPVPKAAEVTPAVQAKPAEKAAPAPGSAEEVAAKLQAFYGAHAGFHAKFVQAVKKKGLATPITREGQAWILKGDAQKGTPGKMRWDYPNEEVFYICNGDTLWSYEKRERLATKVPVKNSQLWQATAYLVGQGDLAKDFILALDKSPVEDAWALKLVPRKGTQVMKSLTLLVDKKTGAVRGSVLVDPLDDSTTLQWKDAEYDVAMDAKHFEWTPPPGVTVKNL